jgi:hypothetical protein
VTVVKAALDPEGRVLHRSERVAGYGMAASIGLAWKVEGGVKQDLLRR